MAQASVRRLAVIVCTVVLLLPAMAFPNLVPYSHAGPVYLPHAAILIDGNSGFVHSNGVTGGSGAVNDPFIISGWDIAGQNAAIEIRHTDAYLVIRNVYLHSNSIGIRLYNLTNARVESSLLVDQAPYGVSVSGSVNVTISRNNMTRNFYAVNVEPDFVNLLPQSSSFVYVTHNNIWNGSVGVETVANPRTPRVNITSNNIGGNNNAGIDVASTNAIIAKNNITRNRDGVSLSSTVDASGNYVSAPSLVQNYIAFNEQGILSVGAVGITLDGNTLVQNGFQISTSWYKHPEFYNSHNIPLTNVIDGKPLLYLANCHNTTMDGRDVAEIVVGGCENLTLANLQIQNTNSTAIQMGFVHNVTLTNVNLANDAGGLQVEWSDNVSILRSAFRSNSLWPIYVQNTGNVSIRGNSFTSNRFTSIQLMAVTHLVVSNNNVTGNLVPDHDEIAILDSSSMLITNNTLRANAATALTLTGAIDATISQNMIGENGGGITITSINGLNLTANAIFYNGFGLNLFTEPMGGIFNAIVYHNNFAFNTEYQASHDNNTFPAMDNGYPTGGNYWSDFNGTDNCSGPSQNVCNSPDGIGDTPYRRIVALIPESSVRVLQNNTLFDTYPLMKPFGDFASDKVAPTWALGAILTYTNLTRTSVLLHWPVATDDTWVQDYKLYQNGRLLTQLAGSFHDYNATSLSPGTSYLFRVETVDVAGNPSSTGLSVSVTTNGSLGNPVPTGNPSPTGNNNPRAGKPPSGSQQSTDLTRLIASELSRNYQGLIIGSIVVLLAGTILILRRSRRTEENATPKG